VVDDEACVRVLLEKVLIPMGYSVDTIGDPGIVSDKLDSSVTYNAILLDIRMPGMSGTELYFRILEKAPALKNKIIIVTGDVMGLDVKTFLAQNNLPFLSKPFDITLLKKRISDIITSIELYFVSTLIKIPTGDNLCLINAYFGVKRPGFRSKSAGLSE
jgi:CheY-like chemotaxis protein